MKTYFITGVITLAAIGALLVLYGGYHHSALAPVPAPVVTSVPLSAPATNTVPTAGYGGYSQTPVYGSDGYGMMDGTASQALRYANAIQLLTQTTHAAQVDIAKNEVTFTGRNITVAMAAVQPSFPDTTFEVAGLVDPTIVVPEGARVTIDFINMDYGDQMDHGVELTSVAPPYPVLSMMGMPGAFAGIPVLPPRQSDDVQSSVYPASSVTFEVPPSGTYYYLCQYYDHASKGMYGRFIVQPD